MKKLLIVPFSFICLLVFSSLVKAHDLWLQAQNYYLDSMEKIEIKVVFDHNFPYEDILIPKKI